MSNKKLSNYIDTINKLNKMNTNELVEYVNSYKNITSNKIINILCLSDHDINDFIDKIEINLFSIEYTEYYNIIDNQCYYHFITILSYLKKTNEKMFFDIIKHHDYRIGWILFYAIENILDPIIYDLWNLIKDTNLLYTDKVKNVNLLFIIVQTYIRIIYDFIPFNEKNEKDNMINTLWKIITEYHDICPSALYHKLNIPIINHILLYETRAYVIFPLAEYDKVKMEINPYILKLLDKFVDQNNVDLVDYKMENTLIYAIGGNHYALIKYLLDAGANINYKSYSGGIINTFESVIKRGEQKIMDLFYDKFNSIDFTYVNHNLNNYAHIVFYNNTKSNEQFKQKVLEYSDNLDIPNIEKTNILHIMFDKKFTDDITKYFDILIKKKLNFSQIDIFGKSPIDILFSSKKDFNIVVNQLIIPNYIYFMNQRIKSKELLSYDQHIINTLKIKPGQTIKLNDLNEEIANYIAKVQISGQLIDDKDENVLLLRFNNTDYSLFTASHFDSYIYSYVILRKYNNLGTPYTKVPLEIKFQCNNNCIIEKSNKSDNCMNDYMMGICNDMTKLVKYNTRCPSLYFNIGLLWHNQYVYHIPENMLLGIKNVYQNTNGKKYIFFINVNIMRNETGHANIIIINLKTKIAIRFEPYGNIDWDEMKQFDEIFQQMISKELPDIKYISNEQFCPNLTYQSLSGESNINFIKLGDPLGYCLAWCFWFLESYIMYEKKLTSAKQLKSLLDKLFKKIIFEYTSLLDYIREYGNYLRTNEINLYKKLNIPSDRIYNKYFNDDELDYIYDHIENNIKKNYNLL